MATNLVHLHQAAKDLDRQVASLYTPIKEGKLKAYTSSGDPIDHRYLHTTDIWVEEQAATAWSNKATRRKPRKRAFASRRKENLTQTKMFDTEPMLPGVPDGNVTFTFTNDHGKKMTVSGELKNAEFILNLLKESN